MDKEKLKNELKSLLSDLAKAKITDTPFSIANAVGLSFDEMMNFILDNEELKKLYTVYKTSYQNCVLGWSYANKAYSFIDKLLIETGILDNEEKGNDLELIFNVDLKGFKP